MRKQQRSAVTAIALAALAAVVQVQRAQGGQISTMEGDIDTVHQAPGTGEPAAYTWGDSFDSNQVDHTPSIFGITDGLGSMQIRKPAGGFSWGTQYLFNDPANQPRYTDLVGAGTTDTSGNFTLTNPSATKILLDIATPVNQNIVYSVGFSALNYGFVNGGFPGYFLDSYNPSGGGNYYQFTANPNGQTDLRHQTYVWDAAGEFRSNGVPLWDHMGSYVLYHMNVNSGTLATDSISYYDNFRVVNEDTTVRSTWNGAAGASADWSSAGSWQNGVPNAVGAPAIFYGNNVNTGTGALAVTFTANVNAAVTVGSIIFDSTETAYTSNGAPAPDHGDVNYTISGTGSLTMDVASGLAEIYVISGSNQINVPVQLNDDTVIDTAAGFGGDSGAPNGGRGSQMPTTSLTFGAPVTIASGTTLKTRGAGTVGFAAVNGAGAGLTINGGQAMFGGTVNVATLTLGPAARAFVVPGGTPKVLRTTALNVGSVTDGVATMLGTLDLADGRLIVDYSGASPLATIQSLLTTGRGTGAWDGPGIQSSVAAAGFNGHTTALGYAESSAALTASGGTFAGQSVDGTAVLVRYTLSGDSNVDGKVDLTDFTFLAANFNGTGKNWLQGDYNYDGKVDLTDFTFLASNFNQSIPADGGGGGAGTLVPEPSSFAGLMLAATTAGVVRRRRSGRARTRV